MATATTIAVSFMACVYKQICKCTIIQLNRASHYVGSVCYNNTVGDACSLFTTCASLLMLYVILSLFLCTLSFYPQRLHQEETQNSRVTEYDSEFDFLPTSRPTSGSCGIRNARVPGNTNGLRACGAMRVISVYDNRPVGWYNSMQSLRHRARYRIMHVIHSYSREIPAEIVPMPKKSSMQVQERLKSAFR